MKGRCCSALRADGRPCEATPLRDADRCVFHDLDHADEVADARKRGGHRRRRERTLAATFDFPGLSDVASIRRLLEIAAFNMLGLEPSPGQGRVLVAIAGAATRLLEVGDVADRLAALERAQRAGALLPTEPQPTDDPLAEEREA